jgi:hypothetical protein
VRASARARAAPPLPPRPPRAIEGGAVLSVTCDAQILRKSDSQADPPYGRGPDLATPCGRMGSLPQAPAPRPASLALACSPPTAALVRARAAQGEIKEGSESEVRAAVFVVALTREVDAASGALCWKAAEISYNAGTLFL